MVLEKTRIRERIRELRGFQDLCEKFRSVIDQRNDLRIVHSSRPDDPQGTQDLSPATISGSHQAARPPSPESGSQNRLQFAPLSDPYICPEVLTMVAFSSKARKRSVILERLRIQVH